MTVAEFINRVGFKVNEGDVQKVNGTINDIKATATKVLGAIGIGLSLTNMNALVEEFDAINDKINFAVSGLGDVKEAQKGILDAANAVKTSYSDMASVVTNLVKSSPEMFPVDQAISFSTNLTKLMKSAGRNDAEIAGIMDAMNKSFQKGAVDSETLNQMLEQAPETANYLAERVGVARTNLLQMATDGTLTVNDLRDAFVASSDEIDAAFGQLNYGVSDALLNMRNKWGFWLKETDEMLGLTQTIGKVMVKGFDMAMGAINGARNAVMWLSDKLGGTENLFKLIAIAVGAAVAAMSFGKVTSGLSSILKLIKSINLKMLSIVAVIVLVALLVEDFINFMQGNDSVIGSLLEKAGVDVDAVRQNIINAWTKIKSFLFSAWGAIKTTCSAVWNGIRDFFAQHGEEIKTALTSVWRGVSSILAAVWRIISTTAIAIWNGLTSFWAKHGEQIKSGFVNVWTGIKNLLSAVWSVIKGLATVVFGALAAFWSTWGSTITTIFEGAWNVIKTVFAAALDVLADLFAVFSSLFAGDWSGLWANVQQLCSDAWNGILNIISTVLTAIWNVLSSIWSAIWGFLSGILTSIWDGVTSTFTNILSSITNTAGNIKTAVVDGFQAAIDWIKSLPEQALQWGADIIQGIVDGITGAVGAVGEAVAGVADKIKSFLGFSEPEDGPLSNFHTYMPDMIQLMAEGIQKGKSAVGNAIRDLAGDMSDEVQNVDLGVNSPGSNEPKDNDPKNNGPRPKKPWGSGSNPPQPAPTDGGGPVGPAPRVPRAPTNTDSGGLGSVKEMLGSAIGGIHALAGTVKENIGGAGKIRDAMSFMMDGMNALMSAATPRSSTVNTVTGSNNVSRSVVQNVEINNRFEGDRAGQQKSSQAMKEAGKDITSELARGLSYTR